MPLLSTYNAIMLASSYAFSPLPFFRGGFPDEGSPVWSKKAHQTPVAPLLFD
ncbi:MAG: hypothetical protein LUQ20_04915 [Candidatus Methanoperedens sp.]|nr:hypothetical protein [Candidatus Methanoperedens sp.]